MTANAMVEQTQACLEAGMDAVLAKPITIDQIRAAVQTYAGRRRLVQERLRERATAAAHA
jgi:CheY-like chemotaxis protein